MLFFESCIKSCDVQCETNGGWMRAHRTLRLVAASPRSEPSEDDNVVVIIELERCVDDQHGHSLACARHDEARCLLLLVDAKQTL